MAKKLTKDDIVNKTVANFSFFSDLKTGNKFTDSKKRIETSIYVDTGCYSYNALYSGDMTIGFPSNRIVMLAGAEATGKTFFTIFGHVIPLSRLGYFIYYFDTENAVSEQLLEDFGLAPGSFKIVRENTVEDCRERMAVILDQIESAMGKGVENTNKCAFVLDSIGMLSTKKTMDDSLSGEFKKDMTKQTQLKSLFSVITNRMGLLDIPMIMTNHVYAVIGAYIPTKEVSGGSGPLYASSVIHQLDKRDFKVDEKKKGDDKAKKVRKGTIIIATNRKNRYVREGLKVQFYLDFARGLNKWYGVHLLALDAGLLEEYDSKHKEMGVPRPDGVHASSKVWVCKHPDKPATEWVTCTEANLHKEETIGSIFFPVNEWVKSNFKFRVAIQHS